MSTLTPWALRELLAARVEPLPPETVQFDDACGRVLAKDICADRDQPPTDRSAMDGYAVIASDSAEGHPSLQVIGTTAAGEPSEFTVTSGSAVRIFTGAIVPAGADAVVMQEAADVLDDGRVQIRKPIESGKNIMRRGENVAAGDTVLAAGTVLSPAALGLMATVGAAQAEVIRRPKIAIASTGTELRGADDPVEPHQIRDGNRPALVAMLAAFTGCAVDTTAPIPDEPKMLRSTLEAMSASDDLVVTCGGASVGPKDFLMRTLESMGAEILCSRMQMKPGKPVIVARTESCWFVALPGNPLAALTDCRMVAIPLARRLAGLEDWLGPKVYASADFDATPRGRTQYVTVTLESDPHSSAIVASQVRSASVADFVAAAKADGILEVPPSTGPELDTPLPVFLWRSQ